MDSYEITVLTGTAKNGGTDAEVRLIICGENGCTGKIYLREIDENFKMGSKDSFRVDYMHLGKLDHINIGKWSTCIRFI